MSWRVVIDLGIGYDVEVEQGYGAKPTRITVPFDIAREAAEYAARNIKITVSEDNPLIQGTVLAGELEAPHDHRQ
jgi:hypothetical protein